MNDNDMTYATDPWTSYLWRDYVTHNQPQYGTRLHSFPRFAREVFGRLYGDPAEVARPRPEDTWAHKAHEALSQSAEFQALRITCAGDKARAGQTAVEIARQIAATLPADVSTLEDPEPIRQEIAGLLEFAKQGAPRSEEEIEALKARGKAAVAAAQRSAVDPSKLRDAARGVCSRVMGAHEREDELTGAFCAWGAGGQVQARPGAPSEVKQALAKRINRSAKVQRLAELAGRMKRIADGKQRSKVDYLPSEVSDIEQGADLDRILPSEAVKLADPDLEAEFMRAYLERGLLQYKLSGRDREARGPIVVCIDDSGSMTMERETWAKAMAMALIHVAAMQRRACVVIRYDDAVLATHRWGPSAIDPAALMNSMIPHNGGGTEFAPPLDEAMKQIESSPTMKKADIVMITDGEAVLSPEWIDAFNTRRKRDGISVYGVAIGVMGSVTLEAIADTIVPRDQDPGALDVGVPGRILAHLSTNPAARALYRTGLTILERMAQQAGAPSFRALDALERERVLLSLTGGPGSSQGVGEEFLVRARRDVLAFYWGSVTGQRVVGYRPPLSGYHEYADPPPPPGARR